MACPSLHREKDNWTTLAKALCSLYSTGVDVDWNEYHRPFEGALRLVDSPTYAWNNKNYWIQYRGDWNLTKGHSACQPAPTLGVKGFQTSSIHRLTSEQYSASKGQVSAESSMTDPSLQGVIDGHAMNGYGVASSVSHCDNTEMPSLLERYCSDIVQFLHADMAYTMAKRIREQSLPNSTSLGINIADFEYHGPVVKRQDTSEVQPIVVTAEVNPDRKEIHVKWFNPAKELWYCHATVSYEDPSSWLYTWMRTARLVSSRIEALSDMAAAGKASKIATDLAYSLFGKLVNYAEMYQTMQWVILNKDEAVAEVMLPPDTSGTWTVPPHFIDGVVSLSGFILNGGTHFDNTNNFFITPSWKSMRFAKSLTPGGRYLSYVRMVPVDGHSFVGDVYILQGSEIVGVVEAIVFRQWPRVMLNRFFKPPDALRKTAMKVSAKSETLPNSVRICTPPSPTQTSDDSSLEATVPHTDQDVENGGAMSPNEIALLLGNSSVNTQATGIVSRALEIVAEELAVDIGMLTDETQIADLGLDSLMSLVLSQRLRDELGIEIRDAFFLEIKTVGDLKKLLH